MSKLTENTTFRRLRNRYRLVVMNDDTYEEVVTFKLSRLSVYVGLCTVFVLMVSVTVALLTLTPLKYYVPGTGSTGRATKELQELKIRTDSLEQALQYKDQYLNNIKKILQGNSIQRDTAVLNVPKAEISHD